MAGRAIRRARAGCGTRRRRNVHRVCERGEGIDEPESGNRRGVVHLFARFGIAAIGVCFGEKI